MSKLYITNKLKSYREDKGWTQKELAEYLTLQMNQEIGAQTLQKWEVQERSVTAEMALEISRAVQIPTSELVERK